MISNAKTQNYKFVDPIVTLQFSYEKDTTFLSWATSVSRRSADCHMAGFSRRHARRSQKG